MQIQKAISGEKNEKKLHYDYEKLKIKADFLADRLEELRDENFRLHSIISSLKDEIQVEKQTISKLTEMNTVLMKEINKEKIDFKAQDLQNTAFLRRLSTFNLVLNASPRPKKKTLLNKKSSIPIHTEQNITINNTSNFNKELLKNRVDEPIRENIFMLINEGDHDPLEMEPSKNGFSKENLDSNDNLDKKDDEWNLKIKMFFKENGIEDEQNLGDILNKSLEDLGIFYSLNNLIIHSIDNQQQRWEIKNAEKYIENIEEILKEWVVKYNNLQKATIPFFHGIKALISDIEEKFQLFKKNQEIFYILYIFVEFIKRMEKDIELWLMHLKDALVTFCNEIKSEIGNIKECKKKYIVSLEEFEKTQTKIINLKKTQINKAPSYYQALNKFYLEKIKKFENCKNHYLKTLNQITFKFNLSINDKLCFFFLSFGEDYGKACQRISYLDNFLNIYAQNFTKKANISQYLDESYLNSLKEIEAYVKTYNLYANYKLIEKEGYLFKKSHGSKELKKKYYRISEGKFFVLKKEKISSTIKMEEISSLSLIHLKENLEMEYPYMLEIICPAKPKPIILITDSQKSHHEWCSAIKNNIEIMLSKSEEFSPKIKKEENRYNIIENFKFPRESKEKMIEKIFKNNCCADCSNNEACWVSINLCVLLCLECSGIHRKLGPNISKVRSLKLDNLGNEIIEIFYQCGSSSINQIWEANIMNFMHLKPHFDSKVNIKEKWINLKYVDKELLKKKTNFDKIEYLCEAIKKKNILMLMDSLTNTLFNLQENMKLENKNMTILHYACIYGNTLILELLIQNGANLTGIDEDNLKAIDLATLLEKVKILKK